MPGTGNPLAACRIKGGDLQGRHASPVVRELVPAARVVKAFKRLDVKVHQDLKRQ
ncbi:hypothetical protein [Massilia frigida]|uniref:hypothetical protein n=1 Tax=Massilia frigida TaxID=2609281 RepID=UPI0014244145|nr:hypothetical protein [Massilia frigida]